MFFVVFVAVLVLACGRCEHSGRCVALILVVSVSVVVAMVAVVRSLQPLSLQLLW